MITPEQIRLLACQLAPIKVKYCSNRHKELTMEDASLVREFLGLMFIDCALVLPQRTSIVRGSREVMDITEVYFTILNESGEQHETAMLFLYHLLREKNGIRRFRKFFGLSIPSDEEVLFERLSVLEKADRFVLPKILKIDSEGNELVIDECDDEYCFEGLHRYCGGKIARHRSTNFLDALVCDTCHLRVPFLHTIHTHEEFSVRK